MNLGLLVRLDVFVSYTFIKHRAQAHIPHNFYVWL